MHTATYIAVDNNAMHSVYLYLLLAYFLFYCNEISVVTAVSRLCSNLRRCVSLQLKIKANVLPRNSKLYTVISYEAACCKLIVKST